ncbi:MAG: DUF4147 domain-containing protein [Acidimicrobiia bacterium]|nr:DUF4147 domain-containing protein [Acidimicrobiia bacterium]
MDDPAARRALVACFEAGLAAVDPATAVQRNLIPTSGRVVVMALGKAAPAMARGAAAALGRAELEGLVVSNHEDEIPPGLELLIGSHPVPDHRSHHAGMALLDLADTLGPADTALVLLSGGGSALAVAPVPGVSLADLAATNELLLRSGADIVATNTVRRRLSLLKGGGLAAAAHPARLITLAVSDVVGDLPEVIASGPTVVTEDDADAAQRVTGKLGIAADLPAAVQAALRTPPSAHAEVAGEYRVIAGAAAAAHAAATAGEGFGLQAKVIDTRMTGDAGTAAGEALRRSGPGLSIYAGETTVDVTGRGSGGRNQEAALIAATLLDGTQGTWFLAAGTDGIDGTTPAAGAIVDGGTLERGRSAGLDAAAALDDNDSGSFFAALGEQLVTGPTGTNVGDLWLVLRN